MGCVEQVKRVIEFVVDAAAVSFYARLTGRTRWRVATMAKGIL
jgi:hypothetical protein